MELEKNQRKDFEETDHKGKIMNPEYVPWRRTDRLLKSFMMHTMPFPRRRGCLAVIHRLASTDVRVNPILRFNYFSNSNPARGCRKVCEWHTRDGQHQFI